MDKQTFDGITPINIEDILLQITEEKPQLKWGDKPLNEQMLRYQYQPEHHDVMRLEERPNKVVNTPASMNLDGTVNPAVLSVINVARITVPMQKLIVGRAASFAAGSKITFGTDADNDQDDALLDVLKNLWDANKLDFKSVEIAKRQMSELDCAEIWYVVPCDDRYWNETILQGSMATLRMRIVSPELNDNLFPAFDEFGDMIGFARKYKVWENKNQIDRIDTYSAESIKQYKNAGAGWQLVSDIPNIVGKIPVIYYRQDRPEWWDVRPAIDRLETVISNFADTNDYFGAPMIVTTGQITGFASKGEGGKMVTMEQGADIKYLTWESAPDAIKTEIDTLFRVIYSGSRTPDISFESLKGLQQGLSGVALRLMFMDAQQKAQEQQQSNFGEAIQRRLNFIKSALAAINVKASALLDLDVWPIFNDYLPANITETITDLIQAKEAGILSRETAVNLNPLVDDADGELERIQEEEAGQPDIDPLAAMYGGGKVIAIKDKTPDSGQDGGQQVDETQVGTFGSGVSPVSGGS